MKVWNYTIIAITIIVLFQFAGFPTGLNEVLNYLGVNLSSSGTEIDSTTFSISDFLAYVVATLGTATGTGVIIGFLAGGRADIGFRAGFAMSILLTLAPSFYYIINHAITIGSPAWMIGIFGVVFIPFIAGYLYALFEFVSGTD